MAGRVKAKRGGGGEEGPASLINEANRAALEASGEL